ncbi:MAG: glycosyltransferase [Candidatus Sedimenticola sp. (ex Thyasira tokunagai)]
MESDADSGINFGVVVIGRNEGDRLRVCLESVVGLAEQTVYVDSGSTDESVEMARDMGVEVIQLNMSIPFTAARARNEGFHRLLELVSSISYVQFVDGDCEMQHGWSEAALGFLQQHESVAVVCGRRRERFPELTIYNLLCDIEWNTPVGETKACGGDAMMSVQAFSEVQGFRNDLIAGEEPELCVRLRQGGWKIWRLDEEMTLHDAAMNRFSQWWKRSVRAGYAFAEGAAIHGAPPERHWVKEARRARLWSVIIPFLILAGTVLDNYALLALLIYPLQVLRGCMKSPQKPRRVAGLYAFFIMLGKFPEFAGQLKYFWGRLSNKTSPLIEYK